ncbi:MAG: TonB-dependent receptor, partial [Bacteroidota bacterium]
MSKSKTILFFLACLCTFVLSFGQNNDKLPLVEVLQRLEAQYDVRFSYADTTVKDILIVSPNTTLSLDDVILFLEQETRLTFNRLNNRFIAIEQTERNNSENYNPGFTLQRLDEVLVENYLTKGLSKNVDGNISMDPQELGILPGLIEPDVLQTIQALPGVISVDELISNINVRGGTNDQNLILFENIRMYQSGHFFGLISAFNPYLTERVNVSKNGTKVKYGDGVSSIISMANSNTLSNEYSFGAGASLISIDGFAKIPLSKKTELQLAARRSYTDVFLSPTYDAYFERIFRDSELNINPNNNTLESQDERFYFYDVNLKFLYDINETSKIRVNFLNIFNDLDYSQQFINSNNALENSRSRLEQVSYAGSVEYTKEWKNNLTTYAQIYFSNYVIDADNNDITESQRLIQENEVEDLGIRLDAIKPVDKNLNLNFGYQFNEVGVTNLEEVTDPIFRSLVKEVIRTHGLYGEAEFTSNSKNTYARVGIRANYIEKFGEVITEPRLAFSQKIVDHLRIEVLGELKSQSITQIIDQQQDFFGIEKRRWQLSDNTSIPIVKSQQASVGLNYNNSGWLINAEVYTKTVDGITARSQGFQNQFQFVEDIGKFKVEGLDLLINKQFRQFSTWLSYSYSRNDYTFDTINDGEPFSNNLDIRHNINFA